MADRKNMFQHPSIAPSTNVSRRTLTDLLQDDAVDKMETNTQQQEVAVADLEQLVFLGCIEDSKTINGFKFDMRTLTGKEQNDVWLSVSFLGNDTKFFVVKIAFLSRAIVAVNGRELEVLYRGKDYRELTKEQRCARVVESWQDTVINELYEFYSQLVERSKKTISEELIKK